MDSRRRSLVLGLATAPAVALFGRRAFAAGTTTLKISHQFPGGTIDSGDFRDQLCRRFAVEIEKRTNGALKAQDYPSASLMKTNAQFSAMRKGALDMSLVPLSYGGGEVPEVKIGLMPGVVTSYEQGYGWKGHEAGKLLTDIVADKGILVVTWIWQAGGVASRAKPIIYPEDAKGLKVRGGSAEMDQVLKAAGAAVLTMPSDEIYPAMQTGALDAAMTSSTSLISFRLEEVAKNLTTGRSRAYWYMFEPLLISRQVFEKLPKDMQDVIMTTGAEFEKFALDSCIADDNLVASIYEKAGRATYDMNAKVVKKWQDLARETAWKDYAAKNDNCAKLLAAVEKTL